MSLWKWFGIPKLIHAAPSLFLIIKEIAAQNSDKKLERDNDGDKGRLDNEEQMEKI